MLRFGSLYDSLSPFFIPFGGSRAHDSSIEKHFQEGTAEPQISPLRFAPVEMTQERAALAA
jgi:hypothetical protein